MTGQPARDADDQVVIDRPLRGRGRRHVDLSEIRHGILNSPRPAIVMPVTARMAAPHRPPRRSVGPGAFHCALIIYGQVAHDPSAPQHALVEAGLAAQEVKIAFSAINSLFDLGQVDRCGQVGADIASPARCVRGFGPKNLSGPVHLSGMIKAKGDVLAGQGRCTATDRLGSHLSGYSNP